MEFNLKEIEELHKNRKWISWEEEGYLISCVEKAEASNKKLREAIERHKVAILALDYICDGTIAEIQDEELYKALEE